MVITTGSGPQEKVMTPPAATAVTTAAEVQLAGVPLPTTWSGREVSTGCASAGIAAWPFGLPAEKGAAGADDADGLADGDGDAAVALALAVGATTGMMSALADPAAPTGAA
jgi:hypothetical protein